MFVMHRVKYSVEDMAAINVDEKVVKQPVKKVPPYNGIGTEEDSLTSCIYCFYYSIFN